MPRITTRADGVLSAPGGDLGVDTFFARLRAAGCQLEDDDGELPVVWVADCDLGGFVGRTSPSDRRRALVVLTRREPVGHRIWARDVADAGLLGVVSGEGWQEWIYGKFPFTALIAPRAPGFEFVGSSDCIQSSPPAEPPELIAAWLSSPRGPESAAGRLARARARVAAIAPRGEGDAREVAGSVRVFLDRMERWADLIGDDGWPWLDLPARLGPPGAASIDEWLDAVPRGIRGSLARTACRDYLRFEALAPVPDLPNPYECLVEVAEAGVHLSRSKAGGIDVGIGFVPVRPLAERRRRRA